MNLLVLDIDETLIFASEIPLDRAPDFMAGPYGVYIRPYLESFLEVAARNFDVAVWTSSTAPYADAILTELPIRKPLEFVWARDRCTQAYDAELQSHFFVKDLKKLRRRGYDLDRVVVIDDSPKKLSRHYGNHIKIAEFRGDASDEELRLLAAYLPTLADCTSIRSVEKRGWRDNAEGA